MSVEGIILLIMSRSIRFWLVSLSYNFLLELHLLSQMLWWLPSRFVCMCAKVGTSKWLWCGWDCDVQDLEAHFVYMWGTFKRQVQFVARFSKFPWLPSVFSISHWSGINGLVNAFVENSENNKGGVTVCILQTRENLCCLGGEHKLPNWRFMQEISLESSSLLVPGTHWKIALKWVKGGSRERLIMGNKLKRKWYVQNQGVQQVSQALLQSLWTHLAGAKGNYLWAA